MTSGESFELSASSLTSLNLERSGIAELIWPSFIAFKSLWRKGRLIALFRKTRWARRQASDDSELIDLLLEGELES